MQSPSKFLVIEGCNGVGKSTIAKYVSDRTGASTFHYPPEFVSFRREVHLDESVAPLPRLAYYLAATLHLSDLVRAQLTQTHVICDRYLVSPLSLMIADSAIEETEARRLLQPFLSYLCMPDLTLLLTAEHEVASARIQKRSLKAGMLTPVARKMLESEEFFHRRENACRRMSTRLGPIVELDTTNLSPEEMCDFAWSLLVPNLTGSGMLPKVPILAKPTSELREPDR
jgi:thymidylate kinase